MAFVRLVVVSDTHAPRRCTDLPLAVWDAVEGADLLVHAGDWCSWALYERCLARAPGLLGVWGNNDGPELRAVLPEVATLTVGGLTLVVTHESGDAKGREARMRRAFPAADVLVVGHSHIPWDTTFDGQRLLNPGSPTDRRRQPTGTFLVLDVDDTAVRAQLVAV